MPTVHHHVRVADAHAHLLAIETTFHADGAVPLPSPLVVSMPVWTPGSYLVREYARHVEGFHAEAHGRAARARKVRKNAWSVAHDGATQVTVRYLVYANDLTVRTNHVDATHAYWNGAATFVRADHAPDAGARVTVELPEGWRVATPLPAEGGGHVATTFDELCDSPFECGTFLERAVDVHGKTHRLAIWDSPDAVAQDWDRVAVATATIVDATARLVAGDEPPSSALPYDRYLFVWHVSPRGRGGLEHRDSCTLLVKPASFSTRAGWLDVCSLVAHELFHAWNVKRIRPAGLAPYRYDEECPTRLLWWFEGATSYFDWRIVRLAELASPAEWLGHLAEEIARLEDTPGARVHALEDASFDAWIKAYRPDENSLNSTVSYYLKGEVVCLLLDLELRKRTGGRASLDDVVRHLWREHGRTERPVPEDAMPDVFASVAGCSVDDCLASWVRGTDALPVNEVLAHAGLAFERVPADGAPRAALGVRVSTDGARTFVEAVVRGGAAHAAGIDPRDELVAIGGRRVEPGRVDAALAGRTPGERVPVIVARDGRVLERTAVLDAVTPATARIVPRADASAEARALYEAWMRAPFDALATR